jgi:cell division protein FtsQ
VRRLTAVTPRRMRRPGFLRRHGRRAMRIAVPAVVLAALWGAVQLSGSPLGRAALERTDDKILRASALLGLTVSDIEVEGRETTDRDTILAALAAGPGTPILAVNPTRAREQLEALPWVHHAVVERRLPGTLYVRLVERKPLALWQHGGRIELIDREGGVIPVTRLDQFAKLPMVVGDGAATHAAELITMLASEPDLAARITAAIRVGDRRWNLRIDNAIDVLLPADDPVRAWSRLANLERADAILKRQVQAIDLRLPDRLVLRIIPEAAKEAPAAKKGRLAAKST